jgi:outer membrane receptor protein involved in Fe transport
MLAAFIALSARAHAQGDTSTIAGVVSDRTGAVVPGATVIITDTKTNRSFATITKSKGEYSAPSLSVSVYRLKFAKRGFRTTTIEGVVLHADDSMAENVVLDIGSTSETVTVQANQIQPDTETSSLGTTITADQVSQLPTNGRDIMDMLALVAGSIQNTDNSSNNASLDGFPSGQFGANVLVDGGDSTRVDANVSFTTFGIGAARLTRSSIDNVEEVKVLSSNYSAEYGRAIGDIINIITKSGTNNLHGEMFEFFRNDALDAKNYFDDGLRVPLKLNQFGGNLGGPIFRDKLFFLAITKEFANV